jgi:putative redox protein
MAFLLLSLFFKPMQTITAHIGTNPYQTTITNSRHTIIADENEDRGGMDLGPNPGELLMMSLASCTAITLRMYADRKKWDITTIDVQVTIERLQEKTILTRSISVTGTIGQDEKERLVTIANACPMHQTLTHPIEINTNLL